MQHLGQQGGQPNQNMSAALNPEMRRAWMSQQLGRQQIDGVNQTQDMNAMMDFLRNNPQFQQAQQTGQQMQQHQQPQQPQMQHHPGVQPVNPLGHQPTPPMNISQQNSIPNMPANPQNNQMTPQQIEHLLRSNPAAANQTPFLLPQQPQQPQQLQRRMAISADHPDITRQFHLLTDGAGIRPNQNRGPMLGHQQPGQPQQPRTSMMGPQLGGMPIQNTGANLIPPQQQHTFTSPNLSASVVPQRGPSPQMNFQSGQIPSPQLSYDQLMLRLKQMQEEISQTEMELNIISRTRPSEAGQLPNEYAKLQRKKQQMSVLQSWKNALEGAGGQLRQSGGPTPPNTSQTGQMSWNGSNPNPQFTGVPTPVNTADLQNQLALLGQRPQGIQMLRQGQQTQPQQFPFLPPGVSQPNPQQNNEQPNVAQNPQNFASHDAYLQHLRQQQQPTQQPPQSQAPQQAPQQQQHGQNPTQLPQNQWLQQPQPTPMRSSVAEFMAKMRGIPPLEREKFVNALRVFFEKGGKNPAFIETPITFDNHRFMLWDLHREVITNGTFFNVNSQNLWSVIGAKLGFPIVQQTGIPRASDRIGDFVRECHKTYLLQFEQAYLSALGKSFASSNNPNMVMNSGQRGGMPMQIGRPSFNGPPGENNNQGQGLQPAQVLNNSQAQQHIMQQLTPQERMAIMQAGGSNGLQHIMANASLSVEQMKERGVPEAIIANVERYRHLVTRNILKVPEDGQKGLTQQQPPRLHGQQTPVNGGQQRNTPVMPNQAPNIPNGQPPTEFSQNQVPRPSSIGMQRQNAPGVMVLPEAGGTPNNTLPIPAIPTFRPSPEELKQANQAVIMLKQQMMKEDRAIPIIIPEAELPEWRKEFEIAVKQSQDLEKHFGTFAVIIRESGFLQKLIGSTCAVFKQAAKVTNSPPVYVLGLSQLKGINLFLQQAVLRFRDALARLQRGERMPLPPSNQRPPQQLSDTNLPPQQISAPPQQQQQPFAQAALSPAQMPIPQQPLQHNSMPAPEVPRAPSVTGRVPTPQGPAIAKHGRTSSTSLSKPSGVANTPSPATAPTPGATPVATASSPPKTPKSPGKKTTTKPRATKKKGPTATPTPAHAPTPKSITGASPAPSPQSIPTSVQVAGTKRPREEGPSEESKLSETLIKREPTPPQKKVKLEPTPQLLAEAETPLPPSPPPKEEEVGKSAEQVIAEFQDIFHAGDMLPFDFQQACSAIEDQFSLGNGDPFNSTFSSTSANPLIPPTDTQTVGTDVFEFIDFTQSEDDGTINANTPDLIPPSGSGSNYSPESVPDNDVAALAARSSILEKQKAHNSNPDSTNPSTSTELKAEPQVDSMLAILNELEVPYLQTDGWSWDKPMPPAEWAISTS